jgi:hypothetical protein
MNGFTPDQAKQFNPWLNNEDAPTKLRDGDGQVWTVNAVMNLGYLLVIMQVEIGEPVSGVPNWNVLDTRILKSDDYEYWEVVE